MGTVILADPTDNQRTRGRQVSETRATAPVFPPGRYGRRRAGKRPPIAGIVVAVVVVVACLLVTVRLYHRYGQTDYQAQIVGWQEPSDQQTIIKFTVRVPAGGAASCVLRARDFNGNEVGRRTVVVRAEGADTGIDAEETVPTTTRSSVGEVVGCEKAG
jgi:hypothetical protein